MAIFYINYFVIFLLSFLTTIKRGSEKYFAPFIFCLLFLFAGLRGAGVGRDYSVYVNAFQKLVGSDISYLGSERPLVYEPAFYFIPLIAKSIVGSTYYIGISFLIFAFLGVYFKMRAFRMSNSFFLSCILYASNLFFLHEMTQIRAGVATGILMMSLSAIQQRNFGKFIVHIIAACFFHYSSLVFFPIYFISTSYINKKIYLAALGFVSLLSILKISLFNPSAFSFISPKIELYARLTEKGGEYSVLNIWNNPAFIINLIVTILLLFKAENIYARNKYAYILLKINIFSILALMVFSEIPTLAKRVYDLLGVVHICLFPCLIYIFNEKWVSYGIVVVIGLLFVYNYLIRLAIFKPYEVWF